MTPDKVRFVQRTLTPFFTIDVGQGGYLLLYNPFPGRWQEVGKIFYREDMGYIVISLDTLFIDLYPRLNMAVATSDKTFNIITTVA